MDKDLEIRVFNDIRQTLIQERSLTDGQIYDLTCVIAEGISSKGKLDENGLFIRLLDFVKKYKDCRLEEEQQYVFSIGLVMGMGSLINAILDFSESTRDLEQNINRFKDNYNIFQVIDENPGIMQKLLAKKVNKSATTLSHFMNKKEVQQYFDFYTMGREKYYYLSRRGKQLYEKMQLLHKEDNQAINETSASLNFLDYDNSEEYNNTVKTKKDKELDNVIALNNFRKSTVSKNNSMALSKIITEENINEG